MPITRITRQDLGASVFATPVIGLGTTAAPGTQGQAIQSDATIVAFDNVAPSTQAFGDTAVVGTAVHSARRDHRHAMPPLAFVDGVIPTGVIDGANATFALPGAPDPASSLAVYLNGLRRAAGVHYTLAASTITFLAGHIPQSGDNLLVDYRS